MQRAILTRVLGLLAILLFAGCDVVGPTYTDCYDLKSQYANEITNQVAIQLRDGMQLYTCGIGGGCLYNIRMLALSCDYYKEVDIEDARELLVKAGILFLRTANEHEKARPYFANNPFGLKNIELRFFIAKKNGEYSHDKLSVITLIDGILRYKVTPSLPELITIYEETFAEAAEKLGIVLTPETGLRCEKKL